MGRDKEAERVDFQFHSFVDKHAATANVECAVTDDEYTSIEEERASASFNFCFYFSVSFVECVKIHDVLELDICTVKDLLFSQILLSSTGQ